MNFASVSFPCLPKHCLCWLSDHAVAQELVLELPLCSPRPELEREKVLVKGNLPDCESFANKEAHLLLLTANALARRCKCLTHPWLLTLKVWLIFRHSPCSVCMAA